VTKTERYSQSHDTQHSRTHANYHTKLARKSIAVMSYAASTTLYDSTYSERIPHDLPRTWSMYESRSLRVSRHPESRRETNGSLSIKADVTIIFDASVACLQSPKMHENRKLRAKPERQRDTKMATATERPSNGQNRVRGSQIRDGQPHRYSLLPRRDDPR